MQYDQISTENVLVIGFGDDPANDKNAYLALTDLKELDSQRQITLVGAAVVSRHADGRVSVEAQIEPDPAYGGTATGGLIGMLVGILGGPLGMLIGGATGVLVGSLVDVEDTEASVSVLSDISTNVQVGRTALLAQVVEPGHQVIDVPIERLGGTVLRRPLAEVEREIAVAQDAQRQTQREARKRLAQSHLHQRRQEVQDKVDELKSKLHRPKALA